MRKIFVMLTVSAYLALGTGVFARETPGGTATPAQEHAHPEHGPHGGDLIELGKEEYHVEMLHDEKQGVIFFFLLDAKATVAIAIPAQDIVINVKEKIKGKSRGMQFKVAALPQKEDPQGTTTCFATKDEALIAVLDKHGIDSQLIINIGEKQYRGKIEHKHDHDHNHAAKK